MNYYIGSDSSQTALQVYYKFDEGNFFETFWAGSRSVTESGVKMKRNYSVGKTKVINLSGGSKIERNSGTYMGLIIPGLRDESCPFDT